MTKRQLGVNKTGHILCNAGKADVESIEFNNIFMLSERPPASQHVETSLSTLPTRKTYVQTYASAIITLTSICLKTTKEILLI